MGKGTKKSKMRVRLSFGNANIDIDDVYVIRQGPDSDEELTVGDLFRGYSLLEEVAQIMQEQMDDDKRFKKLTKIAEKIQLK
jgi:hypothetical protein